jgi:hypothetical protein
VGATRGPAHELPQSLALHHHATRVAARRCPWTRPGCGCRENRRRRVAGSRQHRYILVAALVSCSCRGTCTCWICATVSHPAQVSEQPLMHPQTEAQPRQQLASRASMAMHSHIRQKLSLDSSWPAERAWPRTRTSIQAQPGQQLASRAWPCTYTSDTTISTTAIGLQSVWR